MSNQIETEAKRAWLQSMLTEFNGATRDQMFAPVYAACGIDSPSSAIDCAGAEEIHAWAAHVDGVLEGV